MRGGSVDFEYEHEALEPNEEGEYSCIMLTVSATISDYDPGCMHLRNGDPGYPPEGGEVEDLEVSLPDGTKMNPITEPLYERLCNAAQDEWSRV